MHFCDCILIEMSSWWTTAPQCASCNKMFPSPGIYSLTIWDLVDWPWWVHLQRVDSWTLLDSAEAQKLGKYALSWARRCNSSCRMPMHWWWGCYLRWWWCFSVILQRRASTIREFSALNDDMMVVVVSGSQKMMQSLLWELWPGEDPRCKIDDIVTAQSLSRETWTGAIQKRELGGVGGGTVQRWRLWSSCRGKIAAWAKQMIL